MYVVAFRGNLRHVPLNVIHREGSGKGQGLWDQTNNYLKICSEKVTESHRKAVDINRLVNSAIKKDMHLK